MTEHFDKQASTWDQDPMKIERSKITAEYCKKAALTSRKSLLDVGGGTGLLSLALHDYFDQITIADSSVGMLKKAEENIQNAKIKNIKTLKIENDISEINKTFSAIITLMTLHHIPVVDDFIRHAAGILEQGGALMIADLYKEDGSFHKDVPEFDGHHGFDIPLLSEKLEDEGFIVSRVSQYYEIEKEISPGEMGRFPLFFMLAIKD